MRSSDGKFSVNWGVLDVRGKGMLALEQWGGKKNAPPWAHPLATLPV